MESPHLAWEFMKKLAKSPWAPVIRLIEDPDVVGCDPSLNLQEDLDDCALVVEETDAPRQMKTLNPECSSGEDSDEVAKYYPSPSDSDNSVVICEDSEKRKSAVETMLDRRLTPSSSEATLKTNTNQRIVYKPCPKSKKPVPPSRGSPSKPRVRGGCGNDSSATMSPNEKEQLMEYYGQLLKLKPLKVVLLDLTRLCKQFRLRDSQKPLESSQDEIDGSTADSESPTVESKTIIVSDGDESMAIDTKGIDGSPSENLKNATSSDVDNLKRSQNNLSWGLESIQELEKRRKLGKTILNNVNDEQEVELVTPCSSESPWPRPSKSKISRAKSKPSQCSSLPDNTFGLNAWRLGLVMQELKRLQELAEKLEKSHLKPELQKQVAYKFKYGLNEVARLVTKKSLNSIVAERERAELKELEEKEYQALNEQNVAYNTRGSKHLSKVRVISPPNKLEQGGQLVKISNSPHSTSKDLKSLCPADRPVVDVYMPTLVQGVAAGFLGIIDRLERLESQCNNIERKVTKSNETSQLINIREVD